MLRRDDARMEPFIGQIMLFGGNFETSTRQNRTTLGDVVVVRDLDKSTPK